MDDTPRSICPFCSMGCTWRPVRDATRACLGEEGAVSLDYDADGGPNRGSLCAKGSMALELTSHPDRLETATVRSGDSARAIPLGEAVALAEREIGRIRAAHGRRSVGILLGPQTTCEEAAAAARLALALGTPHLDLCEPGDHAVLTGIDLAGARPRRVDDVAQIDSMDAILTVGDLLTLAPCMAKPVLESRYRNRRNTLATLSPVKSRTAWFGRPPLRCRPGADAWALTLMLSLALDETPAPGPAWAADARRVLGGISSADLERRSGLTAERCLPVVRALRAGPSSGVLLASEFGAAARPDLVAGLAALLAEATGARFLAMLEGANSAGVRSVLATEGFPGIRGHSAPEILEAAVVGDVRALLVFGADPIAAFPGTIASQAFRAAEFTLVTAPMPGLSTEAAHVVLPSAVFGEKAGTIRDAFGRTRTLTPALAPPGHAQPDLAAIESLTADAPPRREEPSGPVPQTAIRGGGGFLEQIELIDQLERREAPEHEPGTHVLLAEASAANSGDGSLTRRLSWVRAAYPEARVAVSAAHADALGVQAGERVSVRSNWGRTELPVRIDAGLPEGVVTAPHRDPAVRGLLRWRREPAVRCLDPRPVRVSLARAEEVNS